MSDRTARIDFEALASSVRGFTASKRRLPGPVPTIAVTPVADGPPTIGMLRAEVVDAIGVGRGYLDEVPVEAPLVLQGGPC